MEAWLEFTWVESHAITLDGVARYESTSDGFVNIAINCCLSLGCEAGNHFIQRIIVLILIHRNSFRGEQILYAVETAFIFHKVLVSREFLSADRKVFMGPCTETAIIAQFSCYSGMYIVFSTYVLDLLRYVYDSPFFTVVIRKVEIQPIVQPTTR